MCVGKPIFHKKNFAGVTLIELLIVMVIISIMASMLTISFGNPQQKKIKQHGERISALIQLAQEQAILNGQDYGLSIAVNHYNFYRLHGTDWMIITDDSLFRTRHLAQGMAFNLLLDGIRIKLNSESVAPQIFITSDGEVSFFTLDITNNSDITYQVAFDHNQRLVLTWIDST